MVRVPAYRHKKRRHEGFLTSNDAPDSICENPCLAKLISITDTQPVYTPASEERKNGLIWINRTASREKREIAAQRTQEKPKRHTEHTEL